MNTYQKALEERKKQHLMRQFPLLPEGIDFYSNDYLGLARSKDLSNAIAAEVHQMDSTNGATGSRLLSGNSAYAERIEQQVADFHHAEAALIYPSGYAANVGLISSLATKETTLLMDELVHASLIDGARLGRAKIVRFRHNDLEDLSNKLEETEGQRLVIVESLYSMDGDTCPLKEVARRCANQQAMLIVDEAHSMGIAGKDGYGMVQALGLEHQVLARVMTYGKAPGIHGAAVVGPVWLKEYQINFSRSLIFSTAPTPHQFASIAGLYHHLPAVEKDRNKLKKVVAHFVSRRNQHSGNWLPSATHIQSLIIPGNEHVLKQAEVLQAKGINALPIRKPSVPEGLERIRFCLHAFNTPQEIDLLFDLL